MDSPKPNNGLASSRKLMACGWWLVFLGTNMLFGPELRSHRVIVVLAACPLWWMSFIWGACRR
jgi:hypothetical protein